MVLLIDTNILLDVMMERQEFVKDSSMIWKLCETEGVTGYISALTITNLVNIMRKKLDPKKIADIISLLRMIFVFTNLGVSDINLASGMEWNDFEDAVQSATAYRVHADYIVTRNTRDFADSRVPAFTPNEILNRI